MTNFSSDPLTVAVPPAYQWHGQFRHLLMLVCLLPGAWAIAEPVGPQIGYRFDSGATAGWEAGGGVAFMRGNVGQSFSLAGPSDPADAARSTVTYVVAKPWWYIGATLVLKQVLSCQQLRDSLFRPTFPERS